MVPKILFYGVAGSGKDTQSEALSRHLGIPVFLIGSMMREEVAKGTEFGRYAAPFIETGTMVSLERITQFLKQKLTSQDVQATGYVMNGYPRNVESLESYLAFEQPTAVIHLLASDDIVRKRLKERGRADDTPEVIETKLRRYHETEKAACEYVRTKTDIPFLEVDASQPAEEVTRQILKFISV